MNKEEITRQYTGRVDELLSKLDQGEDTDHPAFHTCFAGTLNIVESLYGPESQQLENLRFAQKMEGDAEFRAVVEGTLLNIREELTKGLIGKLVVRVSGLVNRDFVSLAKETLDADCKDVAAVLASAALEDALKRKAEEYQIDTDRRSIEDIISALKARSFFRGTQAGVVASYPKLRHAAMHADWKKIQKPEVNSLIGFLESFLEEHFS